MRLVFQHMPKCAGTSVNLALLKHFSSSQVFREKLNRVENYSAKELLECDYFSGHYDAWRVGLIPGPKTVFTVLREPKSRIISLYNFWRSLTWDYINEHDLGGPRLAKSLPFEEFLTIPDRGIPSNIDNTYLRNALGRCEDPAVARLIKDDPSKALGKAFRYYSSLDFIGFMEDLDEVKKFLSSELSVASIQLPRTNTIENIKDVPYREPISSLVISDEADKLLDRKILYDQQIYDYFRSYPMT